MSKINEISDNQVVAIRVKFLEKLSKKDQARKRYIEELMVSWMQQAGGNFEIF